MKCEWCGTLFHENDRMITLIVSTVGAFVCYECALEWVSEPKLTLDLEPFDLSNQWPRYYSQG